jgi:hypothetical protein
MRLLLTMTGIESQTSGSGELETEALGKFSLLPGWTQADHVGKTNSGFDSISHNLMYGVVASTPNGGTTNTVT